MANFKGGFAFNNEAAKAEVEQAPDGTLISCINPVTGESLSGGGTTEVITGTADVPFPDMTSAEYNQLIRDMYAGNAAATMIIDATALGLGQLPSGLLGIVDDDETSLLLIAQVADPDTNDQLRLMWASEVGVSEAKARIGGNLVDMSSTASSVPTITTIYRF